MMNQRSICAISPAKMNETLTQKPGLNNKKKHIDTDTHPRGFTLKNRMRLEHHFNRILHPTCSLFWNFKKWTLLKLLGALIWCALLRKRNFFKYSYGRWKCCGRGKEVQETLESNSNGARNLIKSATCQTCNCVQLQNDQSIAISDGKNWIGAQFQSIASS